MKSSTTHGSTKSETHGSTRPDRDASLKQMGAAETRILARLRKHLHLERAMVRASNLLVSSNEVDMLQVLRVVGRAVRARCLFLVAFSEDEEPLLEPSSGEGYGDLIVWHKDGAEAAQAWMADEMQGRGASLELLAHGRIGDRAGDPADWVADDVAGMAIPILSGDDRLLGYLGMEYDPAYEYMRSDGRRVLRVLGDLLVSYLRRARAEHALRESEERWRKLVESHPEPILVIRNYEIFYANEAAARVLGADQSAGLVGRSVMDFVSADRQEGFARAIETAERGETMDLTEHELIRLDGAERIVEFVSVPVVYNGRRALQLIFRDVTEQRESEERYSTFVKTISEAVWRVELQRPVSVDARPDVQADHIWEHGRMAECNRVMARLLGIRDASRVVGKEIKRLFPSFLTNLIEEFVKSGYELHNREVVIRQNGRRPRHFMINVVGSVDRGRLCRLWGSCIEVTERAELERRMVAALENQQERIGRDLHDSVGQLLTGIRMLSTNLATRESNSGDNETSQVASKVARFAEEASLHVRNIYRGLAPPQLYQEGLALALEDLACGIDALPGVQCTFVYDGYTDVEDRELKLQLFRIAQEAANNALKHAKADHITITLEETEEGIRLQVRDDGVGFCKDASKTKSLGLYSMKHRAQSVDAELYVESQAGEGTTVSCVVPQRTTKH